MHKQIMDFIRECDICQKNKYQALSHVGLLQPIPIPELVWEDISMEFIIGLPKFQGYEVIFVVIDRLSKQDTSFVSSILLLPKQWLRILWRRWWSYMGSLSPSLVTETLSFWASFGRSYFRLQGTLLRMSTSYHPQIDGQTEVVNHCLETFLYCFASE